MANEIRYVPTVIRWVENGKEQKMTINIQEGFEFNFKSQNQSYTAKEYKDNGKKPILSLSKEDAYSLKAFSKLNGDKDKDGKSLVNGKEVYTLDAKDWDMAIRLRGGSEGLLKNRLSTLAPEAHTFKAQFGHDKNMRTLDNQFDLNNVSIFFNKK